MEIKNNRLTVTGKQILLASAYIALACSLYWLYRIILKDNAQWLPLFMTAIVSFALFYFAKKRC